MKSRDGILTEISDLSENIAYIFKELVEAQEVLKALELRVNLEGIHSVNLETNQKNKEKKKMTEQVVNTELAVTQRIQSLASLYGIASVVVGTGKAPNKKSLKQLVKACRKEILLEVGDENGWELMKGNKAVVEMYLSGIKNDTRLKDLPQSEQGKLYKSAIEDLSQTCITGMEKLF